jgi:predicted phage terminase large subunit-like protein
VKNGKLRAMHIEDKSSGTGLIQTLKRGDNAQGLPPIPVKGIERNKDKITRAMDIAPTIEAGLVYLPNGADFVSDFISEASVFPNGAHDDQLDPMMDAVDSIAVKRKSIYS